MVRKYDIVYCQLVSFCFLCWWLFFYFTFDTKILLDMKWHIWTCQSNFWQQLTTVHALSFALRVIIFVSLFKCFYCNTLKFQTLSEMKPLVAIVQECRDGYSRIGLHNRWVTFTIIVNYHVKQKISKGKKAVPLKNDVGL